MGYFGVDVGYSAVKARGTYKTTIFPSVVGSPLPKSSFSIGQHNTMAVRVDKNQAFVPVGLTALEQSQYATGSRDAGWVLRQEWRTLLMAALGELLVDSPVTLSIVTGLPVYDWQQYATQLRDSLKQTFIFTKFGNGEIRATVENVTVVTQPYGSLLNEALDDEGNLLNNIYTTGLVGVVDIGGNTLNLLASNKLSEISRWTTSDEFGLLYALDSLRDTLRGSLRGFNPQTHEVSEWLAQGSFKYRGQQIEIWPYAEPHLSPLLNMLETRINEVWNETGRFDALLLTGGGALTLGRYLEARLRKSFGQINMAQDARWANVNGYFKYARREFG